MAAGAASTAARAIICELAGPVRKDTQITRPRLPDPSPDSGKIVLQPRLCTLRSYGSGPRDGIMRSPQGGTEDEKTSLFFASLADYIESSRKSQDFEIVSGRLAMIAFAVAVVIEGTTGNSLFKKLDVQEIEEATGVCMAVVACAATFAWFSSARNRIGQMFTLGCNVFVDSFIDSIVEALFSESELRDWSDEI